MIENNLEKIVISSLNGSDLAYIGDAYYELFIRTYLLGLGYTNPNELHKMCTNYVNSNAHAKIMKILINELTDDEQDVFRRGRNYNYKHRSKSSKMSEYLASSGFEAIIGYLLITKQNIRLDEIMNKAIKIIEDKENND